MNNKKDTSCYPQWWGKISLYLILEVREFRSLGVKFGPQFLAIGRKAIGLFWRIG